MNKSDYAVELHKKGYNCCQAVACAFSEELGAPEEVLFRLAEGFGLGMGNRRNTCGAVCGMVICLGLLNSAGDLEAPNSTKRTTMRLASQLTDRFLEEHGSVICGVLKGETGCPVIPCDKCIADAATYVEEAVAALKI